MKVQPCQDPADLFGPVIYPDTRADALALGAQVEVMPIAHPAGRPLRVFATRAAYDLCLVMPSDTPESGPSLRLWQLVQQTHLAIQQAQSGLEPLPFSLHVNLCGHDNQLVRLVVTCGPLDQDDPQPVLTVRLFEEDGTAGG